MQIIVIRNTSEPKIEPPNTKSNNSELKELREKSKLVMNSVSFF
jgi:hypothetical protein